MTTVEEFRQFAFGTLLPLCRDRFADPVHGGFHERLDAELRPLPLGTKRLVVQCRQLYVLSHAALLGDRSGTAAAEVGYAFLRRCYHDERHGGWYFQVAADGQPADRRKDFYGHAFVLLALGYLHRAFAAPGALDLAAQTMAVLDERLTAPNGGFWEAASEDWQPNRERRRQNPHMHLLEALLVLFEATADRAWLDRAAAIVELFATRLYDPGSRTLREHFAADWTPHPQDGDIVEPGHHFEWTWLLHRYAALAGRPEVLAAADALYGTAIAHGFDPTHGGIHDQIDPSGRILLPTRRIWPVTEAIKAAVVVVEGGRAAEAERGISLIRHLFDSFIPPAGDRWFETLSRDGTPTLTELPGTTPYHLFLAAAEATRVLGGG
ncbi:MAG: hypothetical protein JWL84_2633 [Rhodospirillales bacterium]|nr:hypothetical protein [Rhodospirillales bacterium]